jgi:hydrogenase maturation protease
MLVMGIGNVLMMDDGIGVYLAKDLKTEIWDEEIRFVIGETDVDYCLSEVKDDADELVIVIDAIQCGDEKGSISEQELIKLGTMEKGIAAHNYHLFHAICSKKGILIGIEPFEISFGFGLSTELRNRYPKIKQKVKEIIMHTSGRDFP